MNKFDLVCGTLLLGLGVYSYFAKPAAPQLSGVGGAPTLTGDLAAVNAAAQRRTAAALGVFGVCVLVDAFGLIRPTLAELGLALLFAAGAWEYRLDLARLTAAGVPSSDPRLRRKRAWRWVSEAAAAFFLIAFALQFAGPLAV